MDIVMLQLKKEVLILYVLICSSNFVAVLIKECTDDDHKPRHLWYYEKASMASIDAELDQKRINTTLLVLQKFWTKQQKDLNVVRSMNLWIHRKQRGKPRIVKKDLRIYLIK